MCGIPKSKLQQSQTLLATAATYFNILDMNVHSFSSFLNIWLRFHL
jgi:hypothetical protein